MKLIIFDMDQTLVDFIFVHDEATAVVFRKFLGVDARLTEIDFAGRSLQDSFSELAKLKKVSAEKLRRNIGQMLEAYDAAFIRCLPEDAGKYILPGVESLLNRLSETDNIIVLYTGDSRDIVTAVLGATGLGKYFRFRFYGTEVKARADMVRLAVEQAETLTGRAFKNKDIVIIGDATRDVECGRVFNALTIAVATGFHTPEQHAAAGADYLFPNLADTDKVLAAIAHD